MKFKIAFLVILFCFPFSINAQEITYDWVIHNYTKKEVLIPMRDGTKLFTAIYEPKQNSEKHPILFFRTPYSISPYGKNKYNGSLCNGLKEFTEQQYIFVFQDVRGRYMSEGNFLEIRPFNPNKQGKEDIDESSDSYDTVEWLLKHTHNNGNVGVMGTSYGGFYAAMAGFSNHPAIKAISPQAPIVNWYLGDDIHHNGALMLADAYGFLSSMEQPRRHPCVTMQPSTYSFSNNLYDDFLKAGTISYLTTLTGDSLQFWNDVVNHPDYDDFWKARDVQNGCMQKIKPAVLVVGGQFDAEDLFGTLTLHHAINKYSPKTPLFFIFGPWNHGGWNNGYFDHLGQVYFNGNTINYYQKEVLFPFFEYYLRGVGKIPLKNHIFVTGINRWIANDKTFISHPKAYYFNQNGILSREKPTTENSYSEYVSDPKHPVPYTEKITTNRGIEYMVSNQKYASERQDVLTFQTSVLKDTVTLLGAIDIKLYTSITTTDADYVVKLIDVFPNDFSYTESIRQKLPKPNYPMGNYQMLVRGDVMRGKYRNSFTTPAPFEPNKITKVEFQLNSIAHAFLPGHRIMVQIQSSWFPLVDRNPQIFTDIYKCNDTDFTTSTIKIYHQRKASSKIMLPIIDKSELKK